MAQVQKGASFIHRDKPKVKRPGIHSKCKTSRLKTSKYYKKPYVGQGK